MKTQLIMLDTPIIVNDEKIKEGDDYYSEGEIYLDCEDSEAPLANLPEQNCNKIIAGIAGLPTIDWNGLEEEFGWVDVEKLAMDKLKNKWAHLYQFGYPQKPFPTNYENDLNLVKVGIYETQSLNEKKFSLEDMKKAIEIAQTPIETGIGDYYPNISEIIQSLQQPKVFDIEVEIEVEITTGMTESGRERKFYGEFKPKITNNSIKILKKL